MNLDAERETWAGNINLGQEQYKMRFRSLRKNDIKKIKEYKEKKTQTKLRRTPALCGLVCKENKGDHTKEKKKKRQRNGRSVGMPDITLTRFAAPPRH